MSIINNHTDKTVTFTTPAASLPNDWKLCGLIRKTISGDSVIASTQLGAGDFTVHVSMTAFSQMTLPSIHVSYSYLSEFGTTTNEVKSEPVNVKAGQSISSSVNFTSDGQGTINVALRGAGQGIYQVECKIYKIVQEKAHV
jgi:hypothetical protein